jgi:5-methylthioadenosine/S-adenosylhomocysteine deaminase
MSTAATVLRDGVLVTMAEGSEPFVGWLGIGPDGVITAVEPGVPPAAVLATATEVRELAGRFVMPGFVSAHNHLWQSAFRGIAADRTLWGWIDGYINTYGAFHAPGDYEAFTRYGAVDALVHGVTTVCNWTHNSGYAQEQYLEQFRASSSLPQRFLFGWGIDTTKTEEENRRDAESFCALAHGEARGPRAPLLGPMLGGLGVLVGDRFPAQEGRLIRDLGLRCQIHYLEEPSIQVEERALYPVLVESGMVDAGLTFAHFCHADDEIVRDAAARGAGMAWNPLSNGRLGSGLPDILGHRAAGLPIALGVDGQSTADLPDPFENMRMGLYAVRMRHQSASVLSTSDVMAMHTVRAAELLGVGDVLGSLEVGKWADLLVVDPRSPDRGPVFDPMATLVFSCTAANIDEIRIGGDVVVRHGRPTTTDWDAICGDVHERMDQLRSRQRLDDRSPSQRRMLDRQQSACAVEAEQVRRAP